MQNVTIRQLRVFVTIVETGGFGSAAEQLAIAQTSVSAHILSIEEQLGQPIFTRRPGRTPVLTELGDSLLGHARTILAEVDALMARVGAREDDHFEERIVFACQRSVAYSILPSVLARFAHDHPSVELVTRVGNQEEVVAQLQDGSAAVGCLISNDELTGIASEVIGSERYVLIADAKHPLAGRHSIDPREIERFAFVGPPQSSLFGRSIARLLRDAGVRRMIMASRATEYQVLRQLVIAGVGIACSAAKSVAQDVKAGDLVILPMSGPPLTMKVRLLMSEIRRATPAAHAFIEEIRDCWKAPT